ncbi:MAG: isocitrate/isopropylmalate family dehydrogenase [Desulfarculaceae bacterium]|jgi:3-isopropylmalate dehydrogenase
MSYDIAVIPGDGIGPEVVEAEIEVLKATGVDFAFSTYDAGDDCLARTGEALPQETLEAARKAKAVIFGAAGACAAQVIIRLRQELSTWVNLRPSRCYSGVDCLHQGTDLVVVRENSEGLYLGLEETPEPGLALATRRITEAASLRIARYAFQYAQEQGRNKVSAAHKVNVLPKTEGLFLDCCRRAAGEFPDIAYEEVLIDSMAMHMVQRPQDFSVIVTTNMFGDIISDLAAGLIGGLGMCPSANLGDDHALFEPVHGTAPDIAGQGKANPSAAILCGAMLLRHLGEIEAAKGMEAALDACLVQRQTTADLGGSLSTMEMARAVADQMG